MYEGRVNRFIPAARGVVVFLLSTFEEFQGFDRKFGLRRSDYGSLHNLGTFLKKSKLNQQIIFVPKKSDLSY